MKEQHTVSEFTQSALSNLRTLVDANSIIGDPITTPNGAVIVPISKVSFGYGSVGSDIPVQRPDLFGGGTGGGVTIQPLGFLVICGEKVELLQMQTANNTGDRIVNAVPGILDKVMEMFPGKNKGKGETAPEAGEQAPGSL